MPKALEWRTHPVPRIPIDECSSLRKDSSFPGGHVGCTGPSISPLSTIYTPFSTGIYSKVRCSRWVCQVHFCV